MVLAPVAGVKSRGGFVGPTGRVKPFNPRDDGDKKELVAGESTKETVKTIAQGRPDCSGYTCGDYRVLFFAHGPWVRRAPGLPCALVVSRDTIAASARGALRPASAKACLPSFRGDASAYRTRNDGIKVSYVAPLGISNSLERERATFSTVVAGEGGRSSTPRHQCSIREAAAYWIPCFRGV